MKCNSRIKSGVFNLNKEAIAIKREIKGGTTNVQEVQFIPIGGSIWKLKNPIFKGEEFVVVKVHHVDTKIPDLFPIVVCFKSKRNGMEARSLKQFIEHMEPKKKE